MEDFNKIKGLKIKSFDGLEKGSEELFIKTECGRVFKFYHQQDCCESVWLDDFEFSFLESSMIGKEVSEIFVNTRKPESFEIGHDESKTFTFYTIKTIGGGDLWMRWVGASNGYYSEDVDFIEVVNNG